MTEQRTSTLSGPKRFLARRARPELYTEYAADQAILNTPGKRTSVGVLLLVAVIAPFMLSRDLTGLLATAFIFAIGAIGLNLVTGYAGQVSLGHAFFVGLGAYTAAFVGSPATGTLRGLDLEMWIWLPAAGLVAALVGFLVAPLAARVRGLYLAILTLGLVFIGEHFFKEMRTFTGGPGVGRRAAAPVIGGFQLNARQEIFGIDVTGQQLYYLFCLLMLIVFAIGARNLARSKVGRAFAAVRDRDIAAEVMGVPLTRTKVLAFTVSSFYAGICGGLLAVTYGQPTPENFNLTLSVIFLAMILIGGVATVSGAIIGAIVIQMLPRFVQWMSGYVPGVSRSASGGIISVDQLEGILFGVLIVLFLVIEPRGLFGLWLRIRNYWKAWPFSY
ncbi:branched-chain amino acid ABC transporter permease [Nitriliruptor alkaliphilus]|uniref:branched-chain amino acid ABC transporter permease n=1 Tax=Nitriliruptor alkaliphilus TaxID=427918 RepID=UPI0006978D13|nr:branched-chain amino acid ABC transporter permease [Nitriliruptor alkaliphilus]